MKSVLLISLVISLTIFFFALLPVRMRNRKKILYIGAGLYFIFIATAIIGSTTKVDKEIVNISKTNVKVIAEVDNAEESMPVIIDWEAESKEVRVDQVLNLKLKVTNKTKEDIDPLKLDFPNKRLQDQFVVSGVNPKVNIIGQNITLGRVEVGQTVEFVFELIPKSSGLFEAVIIPLDSEGKPLVDESKSSYNLRLEVQGKN